LDQKIPFTSYDFWAYLSAGFLLLFAVDITAGTGYLLRETWTVVQGVIAVALAYVVGQLIASVSSTVLEKLLVGKMLGYPREVLFGQVRAASWIRACLPGYFEPLPRTTQQAALERGEALGVRGPGESLFWPAFAHGRNTPAVMSRLNDFLNQYGFCRNAALVGLLDAIVFALSYAINGTKEHLVFAAVALLIGVGMTLRYLKFYRHYAVEVFTAFAYADRQAP